MRLLNRGRGGGGGDEGKGRGGREIRVKREGGGTIRG